MARNPYAKWTKQAKKDRNIVTGVKEIDRKLRKLPITIQRKVVRPAMRAGMKIVLAEAKSRAPVESGRMKKALKIVALKRSRARFGFDVRISAKTEGMVKISADGKRSFYPSIVEYGRKKDRVVAHPFMRPTFEAMGPRARDVTMKQILVNIEKEAAK